MSICINKKNINKMTIFALVCAFIFIILLPSVHGAAFRDTVTNMADSISNSVYKVITEELTTGEMYKMMTGDGPTTFGAVYTILKSFGMFFVLILAMGNCLERIDKGMDGTEAVFKTLIEIAVSGILILNLDSIMTWIVQFGNYVIGICTLNGGGTAAQQSSLTNILKLVSMLVGVAGTFLALVGLVRYLQAKGDGDGHAQKKAISMLGGGLMLVVLAILVVANAAALTNAGGGNVKPPDQNTVGNLKDKLLEIYKDGMFSNLGAIIEMLIPWVVSLLLGFAAKFVSYSLLLEIGIRRAFAPIAVIGIYQDGMRSQGVRYLKKYFCTYLKIAIALVASSICGALEGKMFEVKDLASGGSMFTFLFGVLALNFTVIGVILKGGEYANDIMGV